MTVAAADGVHHLPVGRMREVTECTRHAGEI
jgi:hypothetical protein